MDAGADLCVTSVHKSGSGLEQASCFHLKGPRVDPAVLSARADLLSTTSPSALMYAALDGWRRQMVQHGQQLLEHAATMAAGFADQAIAIPGLDLDLDRWRDTTGVADRDPRKVCPDVWRLGMSGYDAAEWLRERTHVDVALADHRRLVVMFSHADDPSTVGHLVNGPVRLSEGRQVRSSPLTTVDIPAPGDLDAELAMAPREAFFARTEQVPLSAAAGRVCAELVSPYPPGIPVLAPGETVATAHIDYLRRGIRHGMYVPDPADKTLKQLRFVA
jgi:arginine/lysine/ornithine decarboxylase